MFETTTSSDLLSILEINHLRLEAINLYDRCLAEGNLTPLEKFIELQLTYDPPQIQLLGDIANDLQQRLLTLKAYHFDVRHRIVNMFEEMYKVDVTHLMPADQLEIFHFVQPNTVMLYLVEQSIALIEDERLVVLEVLRAACDTAGQLHADIQATEKLHDMILDWIYALGINFVRAGWQVLDWTSKPDATHIH
jgi:hypothetical protein